MDYRGLRATVMGLGHFGGGVAAAKWLARSGARVTVTDISGEERLTEALAALQGEPIRTFVLGRHRQEDFRQTDLVVVNPAVRPGNPWIRMAEEAGAVITSETQLFLETCRGHVVGVTGTNGKSTTAAMIAAILRAAGRRTFLGGNIGHSLLAESDSISPGELAVVEISSFQLFHLGPGVRAPETAVVTNFLPNHLDWHGDLPGYAAAKQRILLGQKPGDIAVFDPSAPGLAPWRSLLRGSLAVPRAQDSVPLAHLPGQHNLANAALAAAAARSLGCSPQAIEQALAGFRGLPDRLQWVATIDGRSFYNDSASTTPESAVAALHALPTPLWLLAGGGDKGCDFSPMIEAIADRAAGAVFFGSAAARLADLLSARAPTIPCRAVAGLCEALAIAREQSSRGSTIVLSPGCSSHDQFINYRRRGAAFVDFLCARNV